MEFFNSAVDVLKTLVVALGAGLGVWGAVNLMEGYGGDNPSAKSGYEAADGWRRRCPDRYHSGAPAVRSVRLIRSRNKHSLTHKYTSKLTLAAAYSALTNGFQVCAGSLFSKQRRLFYYGIL